MVWSESQVCDCHMLWMCLDFSFGVSLFKKDARNQCNGVKDTQLRFLFFNLTGLKMAPTYQ